MLIAQDVIINSKIYNKMKMSIVAVFRIQKFKNLKIIILIYTEKKPVH